MRASQKLSHSSSFAVSLAFLVVAADVVLGASEAEKHDAKLEEMAARMPSGRSLWPPFPIFVVMRAPESSRDVKRNQFEFLSGRAGKRSDWGGRINTAVKRDQFDFLSGRAGKRSSGGGGGDADWNRWIVPWKRNGFDFLAGRAGKRSGNYKKKAGSGGGQFDFLSGRAGKRASSASSSSLDFLSRAGRSAGNAEVVDEGALQQALPLDFLYDVNSG